MRGVKIPMPQKYIIENYYHDKPGHRHKYFCVDHDHKTKENRGLLCHRCNRGIGLLGENVEHMKSAMDYIIRYKEINEQHPANPAV